MNIAARETSRDVDTVEHQSEDISSARVLSRKGISQILLQIDSENKAVIDVIAAVQADIFDVLIVGAHGFAERFVHLGQTRHRLFRPEFAPELELEAEVAVAKGRRCR